MTRMIRWTLALVVAVGLAAPKSALASPVPAISFNTIGASGNGDNFTLGWIFTLNESVIVSQLGWFDFQDNGLAASHEVGLWTNGGTLLTSATVAAGVAAPLFDGFRYVAISPVILGPGTYVLGGQTGGGDLYAAAAGGFTTDSRITYLDNKQAINTATLAFPTLAQGGINPSIFGPNMQIDAVPEPVSLVLLGTGLAGLSARRLRKRR